jgi:hypothetical protein
MRSWASRGDRASGSMVASSFSRAVGSAVAAGSEEVHLFGEADGGGVAGFERLEDFAGAEDDAGGRPASLATWMP